MPKRKSHYETIGVEETASPEEIKRRFRVRADRLHPDKGGDHAEMSALNHAYEVLSDPARRLLYDRTGEDSQRPFDEQVRALVMNVFQDALVKDAPDALAHAKACISEAQSKLKQQQTEGVESRTKLKARRDKITRKSGPNAFHLIIDQQIAMIDQGLAKIENELKICAEAAKELKQYKSAEEIPPPVMVFAYSGTATSATTGSW